MHPTPAVRSTLFDVRREPVRLAMIASALLVLGALGANSAHASSALPFPAPIRSDDEVNNRMHNILDEHPLTARAPIHNQLPKLIFFPPNPPPLGVRIHTPEDRTIVTGGPRAMAPFVTDPFYAPLSTFISPVVTAYQGGETLLSGEKARIKRWQRERDELLAELRETIARLTYVDANTRLREFIELAELQKERLEKLEREAEALREHFARKAPWNERREWRLAGQPASGPGPGMILEIQVMRAAAYYLDGLLPAQRRLLREIAMELEGTTFLPDNSRPTAGLYLFFQPETARIPRPTRLSEMPPGGQQLLRRFIDEKARLKEDLRKAVYEADASRSTHRLKQLADLHAQRFAEIEQMAEDLRATFARMPSFERMPYPEPLPPHLIERIENYEREKRKLLGAAGAADDAGLAPLQAELDRLRAAIALVPGAVLEEGTAPDAFLTNFLQRRREAEAYYEYDIAVLEPGLSPEQRRLLFGGAIRRLELPLPGPEEQPTLAPGTLLR